MLQILSTSNETATGPELVTNGDFDATGSDLITNGEFSATGTEEVTYPNFTNSDLSQWSIAASGATPRATKSWDAAEFMRLTYDLAVGAALLGNFGQALNASYKVTMRVRGVKADGSAQGSAFGSIGENGELGQVISNPTLTADWQDYEFYVVSLASTFRFYLASAEVGDLVDFDSISVLPLGEDWLLGTGWSIGEDEAVGVSGSTSKLTQSITALSGKHCKVTFTLSDYGGSGSVIVDFGSTTSDEINTDGTYTVYGTYDINNFELLKGSLFEGSITDISVEELGEDWTLGTGWSIGDTKAISTVTGSDSDITQSILTAGKTYRTVYKVVDYTAGTAQAIVTGDEGTGRAAVETYTEDLTTTGTDFSIRSTLGTFDGAVSSVSVKLLGTYDDQSIYVTAADVQTIAQASVYYLVELTSMASKNSLYFLPSSVVANNGRYTKLNFTVISKDALTQPAVGIISFYDSVGGFDTYPMGFYEFKIYEQTSSTNLDPLLATGLLEKGFAFVRDFSGNMQELPDGFNEYDPTLTQYVYSQ